MKGNKLIKRCVTLGIINVLVLIASIFCIVNSIGSYWNQSMNLGMMIVAVVLDVLMLVAFGIFDYVLIEDYVKEYKDDVKENDSDDIMIEEAVETISNIASAADVKSTEEAPAKKKRGRPRKEPVDEIRE